jgi:hypothetical protein
MALRGWPAGSVVAIDIPVYSGDEMPRKQGESAQDLATSLQTKIKNNTPVPGSHEWEGRAKRTNLEERVSRDDAEEALRVEALPPDLDDLV